MNDSATAQELEPAHQLTFADVSAAMTLIDEALKELKAKTWAVPASKRTPAETIVGHAISTLFMAHSQLCDAGCHVKGLKAR